MQAPSAAAGAPATRQIRLTLDSVPENVAVVRHVLTGFGAALGLDPHTTNDLRLAASEACTNAVVHAYAEGDPGVMELDADLDPPLLRITVRDCGTGIALRPGSPGLGLGLPLLAALSDKLEVESADGVTEVRMAFLI